MTKSARATRVLGVAAVHGVAGERWANRRGSPCRAGNTGRCRRCRRSRRRRRAASAVALDYFADDLVARNHALAQRRQLALDDVQIGAAHAASPHAEQHLAGPGVGTGISRISSGREAMLAGLFKTAAFILNRRCVFF